MNTFIKNISVKSKILIILAVDLILILFSIYSSYLENKKMNEIKSDFYIHSKAVYHHLTADMMHDAIRSDCYAALFTANEEQLKTIEADWKKHSTIFSKQHDSLKMLLLNDDLSKDIRAVESTIKNYINLSKEIIDYKKTNKNFDNKTNALKKSFDEQFYAMESSMETISKKINSSIKRIEIEGEKNYEKSIYFKIILIISLIVLAFIFYAFINSSIIKPLKETESTLQNLSRGINTPTIDNSSTDEVGRMQTSVNEIIKSLNNIKQFTNEVAQGKTENNSVIFNNNGEVHEHLQQMRLLIKNNTKELENALYESHQKNEEVAVINEELQSTQEELRQNLEYAVKVNHKLMSRENEIIEQNNFLNALLEGTEYSIISLHPSGLIKVFNKGAEKLLGYSAEEMIDRQTPEILHDYNEVVARAEVLSKELNQKINPGLDTFHAKGNLGLADTNEWTYIHKDGTRIPVLLSVSTIRDSNKKIIGYLGIAVDLRERKKQEELILKTTKEKEIAQEAAKTRELFLANMSHEIRTPMNAIIGLSRLLEKSGELNNRQKEYVSSIHLNSNNLLNLINEILDFSKIEAGKLDLNKRKFNLPDTIKQCFLSLKNSAIEKGLKYQLDIDQKICEVVNADEIRLSQILLNLLSNAIKYSEKGSVTLSAKVLMEEEKMQSVRFAVKDTGVGIPKDKLESIFNPFSQIDNDYARKQGGTGLGLAIVKKLAELYGSFIQVSSEVNEGSEFAFIITFDTEQSSSLHTQILSETSNFESEEKLNILLVEDNEFNRMVAIDTLQLWNKEIVIDSAENGVIALEKLKLKNYQLILMDIQMPLLDGYETTKQIRTSLKLNTPILAMTAHASTKEREKCLEFGMNDFISKPFEENLLFEKIITLTQNDKLPQALQTIEDKEKNNEFMQNERIVNIEAIVQFTKGKKDRIEKMVNMFITDTPLEIDKMKVLLQEKNYSSLKTLAHSLKPKMAYMGLENMKEVAKTIELTAASENNVESLSSLIDLMESNCNKAYDELKTFVENL